MTHNPPADRSPSFISRGLQMSLFTAVMLLFCGVISAQRLPDAGITPENYQLRFTPDLEKATFTGEETIRLKLDRAAATIVLNSAEIEFQGVTVTAGGKTQTASVALDPGKEQVTFTP